MPELPPTILYFSRSTKSSTGACRQMMNVLPWVGLSLVVRPVMAPFWTLQNLGFPSQPSRVRPLKIGLKPDSSSAAEACAVPHVIAARQSKTADQRTGVNERSIAGRLELRMMRTFRGRVMDRRPIRPKKRGAAILTAGGRVGSLWAPGTSSAGRPKCRVLPRLPRRAVWAAMKRPLRTPRAA